MNENPNQPVNKETALLLMEMAVDQLRHQAPAIRDFHNEAAQLEFNYFQELVHSGFTEEQAIKIIQSHGFMPKVNGGSE